MSLVLWGSNLSCTTKIRYTKYQLSIVILPKNIESIIIGIILSDGHLSLASRSKNAYLMFSQSLVKLAYLYFVFNLLNHYCQSYPKLSIVKGSDNIFYRLNIATRSMPCITEWHKYFYENKRKVIKPSIYFYITPIALAHWIMGDGSYTGKGLLLCTDSFLIEEVVLLINVFIIKYSINCCVQYSTKKYPRIYIRKESMLKLRKIVLPHMHESMLYKLGL